MSKIKEARQRAEISQAEMSKRLEIPTRTIEEWEAGNRKPPAYVERLVVAELDRIAEDLNQRKYVMLVTISNPEDCKEKTYSLSCVFFYDEEQYGNGYYVSISGENYYPQYIDLRYDKSFNRYKKEEYLEAWARGSWTGENGSWVIKKLEIAKV